MDHRCLVYSDFTNRRLNVVDFKKDKIALFIALLIAMVATWPLVISPTTNISRHFDLYGVFWLSEGTQYLSDGNFTNVNFPLEAPIGHVDSWLWFIIFWLNHDLIPISNQRV